MSRPWSVSRSSVARRRPAVTLPGVRLPADDGKRLSQAGDVAPNEGANAETRARADQRPHRPRDADAAVRCPRRIAAVPGTSAESSVARQGVVYRRDRCAPTAWSSEDDPGRQRRRADDLARFKTEAEAIARLTHPHIVQVTRSASTLGRPSSAWSWCQAAPWTRPSTARRCAGRGGPPGGDAGAAVQAAHEKAFCTANLKPANVLLTAEGLPKLTDFGLARKLDDQGRTQTGAVLGTPSYMAPEQAAGQGRRSDRGGRLRSGSHPYECLTGRPPFKAATRWRRCGRWLEVSRCRCVNSTPVCRADLETICLKCLRKEAGRRYPRRRTWPKTCVASRRVNRSSATGWVWRRRSWRWCRRNPAVRACSGGGGDAAVGDDRLRLPGQRARSNGGKGETAPGGVEPEGRGRAPADGSGDAEEPRRDGKEPGRGEKELARLRLFNSQLYRVEMVYQSDPGKPWNCCTTRTPVRRNCGTLPGTVHRRCQPDASRDTPNRLFRGVQPDGRPWPRE